MREIIPGVSISDLSRELQSEIDLLKIPTMGNARRTLSDTLIREMRGHIETLKFLTQPATIEHLERWLTPILAVAKHNYAAAEVMGRRSLIAEALSDYPAALFNDPTRRETMRASAMRFFPTPADIVEILEPYYGRLLGLKFDLERLAKAAHPEPALLQGGGRIIPITRET